MDGQRFVLTVVKTKVLRPGYFISAALMLAGLLGTWVVFADERVIRLATDSSTENSGLLARLLPPFEAATGERVHVLAVGSGRSLRLGRDGDVDVVLVPVPSAEEKFVAEGYGVNRRKVMYNEFVIVGPRSDPARVRGSVDARVSLAKIALGKHLFISRGDGSGTHRKERVLWRAAGVDPAGNWYRLSGQGMGQVLIMADELDAYTLADWGTWLAYRGRLQIELLVEGGDLMRNPYSIIAVNPDRFRDINYLAAMKLIAWVTSVPGQAVIADFRIDGEQLFRPLAVQ